MWRRSRPRVQLSRALLSRCETERRKQSSGPLPHSHSPFPDRTMNDRPDLALSAAIEE
jgi:hypothetical protein